MDNFLSTYQKLNETNLHLLRDIYSEEIRFIDPAHEIGGLDNLTVYFRVLYRNVESVEFTFHDVISDDDSGFVRWDMVFRHRSLAGGKSVTVAGATFLRFHPGGKVHFHQDYFDLGAMLYEHLPLVGRLLSSIKKRLGA